jgi:hypothetical protein
MLADSSVFMAAIPTLSAAFTSRRQQLPVADSNIQVNDSHDSGTPSMIVHTANHEVRSVENPQIETETTLAPMESTGTAEQVAKCTPGKGTKAGDELDSTNSQASRSQVTVESHKAVSVGSAILGSRCSASENRVVPRQLDVQVFMTSSVDVQDAEADSG